MPPAQTVMLPTIAITTGEPAGIGPEIAVRAAWEMRTEMRPILIGDFDFLAGVARGIDSTIKLLSIAPTENQESDRTRFSPDMIEVIDCRLAAPVNAGKLDPRNGRTVLQSLDIAIGGVLQGSFDAIVTAPVQKSTINDAGISFSGHTEYLAEQTGTDHVVMMLSGRTDDAPGSSASPLRVALATTHLPLKDVPAAITVESLSKTLAIIHSELQKKFGINNPRILVTGLNPHAGESGYLGSEEIDVIAPVIAAARQNGIDASGPYPADTLFQPRLLKNADCVLAMYHDQGLPVLKYASFGRGVNITLGLPIIRTSVDHGTALDMAEKGLGHADHGSMREAIRVAIQMANCARQSGRH